MLRIADNASQFRTRDLHNGEHDHRTAVGRYKKPRPGGCMDLKPLISFLNPLQPGGYFMYHHV
jgi:hypothetical protein